MFQCTFDTKSTLSKINTNCSMLYHQYISNCWEKIPHGKSCLFKWWHEQQSEKVILEKIYTDNYYENKIAQTVFCRVQHCMGFVFMENIGKNKNTNFKLLYIWVEVTSTKL